ncbi:MAG: S8 family serine peptidase [Romboutsia sp.]|uniref:S8 family serine peptidase n=1 Tax=Romboutsia sp. TaxID=1965302 RepID=UPI003F38A9C1
MNKSFRKFFSLALASGMIVTTNLPIVVQAQTKSQKVSPIIQTDAKLTQNPIKSNVNTNTEEMVSIIVELKEAPLAISKYNTSTYSSQSKAIIEKQQQDFINFAKNLESQKNTYNTKVEFGATYKTVFNGMAMKLPGKDVEKLLESGLVKTIYKNDTVQLELPTEKQNKTQNSEISPLMHDSLNDMNVAKLHEEGIKGKGMKVGVLDTGIDYNHPDLKENYKGGYDCVDEDDSPMEATYEDWKKANAENPDFYPEHDYFTGSSYYTSHGTHVSGTVAANGKNTESEFAVTGVAPEADLYVYRVLGPYGSGSFEDIIQGVEMAVEEEMDVINLSLGSDAADPLSPISIVCDNAMLAGTTTVLANGNAGPKLSTVGTPASSKLSISIGASTTAIKLPVYDISIGDLKVDSNTFSRRFDSSLSGLEDKDLEIVDCGVGQTSDFEGKDLKGKVALIERGELSFNDKLVNAQNAGCSLVLIYNNEDGEIPYYLGESNNYANSVALTKAEGESIKSALENQENPTIQIKQNGETQTEKDLLADFSSRGPVPNTVDIKPDLVAPGASIFSTYPEFINHKEDGNDYSSAYSRISGTSMAAPHIAGLAALIESQNPEYDSFDTKVALMNTSDDLAVDYGVNEVGAGRANALESVKSQISIRAKGQTPTILPDGTMGTLDYETGSLAFGKVSLEDGDAVVKDELIIENKDTETNSFDVSVEYVKPNDENGAKDAEKNNVKLQVKETALASKNQPTKLGVTLTIPENAEHGVYQGYIRLKSTKNENEEYKIPFSVQASQPGIGELQLITPGMNTDPNRVPMANSTIGIEAVMQLNTPMEYIHILVRDAKTDEVIGYVNSIDAKGAPTDVLLGTDYIFTRYATIQVIEDGKLQNYTRDLKDGSYKLELLGESKKGNFYSADHPFVIDNDPADVSFKLNGKDLESRSQVIEMTKDLFTTQEDAFGQTHNAVWVDGKVYDSSVDDLKAMGVTEYPFTGMTVDQSMNKVNYYVNNAPDAGGKFPLKQDGSFNFGVTADDVKKTGYEILDVEGVDASDSRDTRVNKNRLAFVEEGRAYIEPIYDKEILKIDDQVKLNLKFNNLKDIKTIEMSMKVYEDVEAKNIKLKGNNNKNFKLTSEKTFVEGVDGSLPHNLVTIKVEPKKDATLSGNIDLIEIGVKLEKEAYNVYDSSPIVIDSVVTKNKNNKEQACLNLINPQILKDTQSQIEGGATSPALIAAHKDVLSPDKHKATISAIDSDGKKYEVQLLSTGTQSGRMYYQIKGVPVTDEYIDFAIDLPGHFPVSNKILVSKSINGILSSKIAGSFIDSESIPGDVNSDNVIDIKDAQAIAKVFNQTGTNFGEIDLSQDGKVDNLDMYFVVENFGMQNPQNQTTKPEGSKAELEKILKEINYEKPNVNPGVDE